jgi:hypothetical protein
MSPQLRFNQQFRNSSLHSILEQLLATDKSLMLEEFYKYVIKHSYTINERMWFICLWLYSPCGPWQLFQFLNPYTVGRTPWTEDQPVARPLPTHRTTQTQNKHRETSMPRAGFEPTIPVFERAKMVHALDRDATVIGTVFGSVNFKLRIYSLTKFTRINRNEVITVWSLPCSGSVYLICPLNQWVRETGPVVIILWFFCYKSVVCMEITPVHNLVASLVLK